MVIYPSMNCQNTFQVISIEVPATPIPENLISAVMIVQMLIHKNLLRNIFWRVTIFTFHNTNIKIVMIIRSIRILRLIIMDDNVSVFLNWELAAHYTVL